MHTNKFVQATSVLAFVLLLSLAPGAVALVGNPDVSALGIVLVEMSGEEGDPDRDRPRLLFEEAELNWQAYLNPFARGTVTVGAHVDAIELEEAFFEIYRGLPLGLGLKAGKSLVAFGRLNGLHSEAYPFISRPMILTDYLGSEEGMNDVGISLSRLFALPGDIASTLTVGVLQGGSFRGGHGHQEEAGEEPAEPESDESRLGWNARLANFVSLGGLSSLEVGISSARGVNDVLHDTRTELLGLDLKTKLYTAPRNYLTVQGEWISLNKRQFHEDEGIFETLDPTGLYLAADYTLQTRLNLGVIYESFGELEDGMPTTSRVGLYGGLALLEETTVFRFLAEQVSPAGGTEFNRYLLQAVYLMGPHQPHKF